jgi:multicomponent Na+:H+ antiporter subunit D
MEAEIVNSWIPGAIAFLPLLATIGVFVLGDQRAQLRDGLVVMTSAAVLALAAAMYPAISAGHVLVSRIMELAPSLTMIFRVDVFGFYVTLIAAAVWFLVTIYCLGYMEGEHAQTRFYAFFLLTLSGALGSFMASDLFTLFMFFELMSLPAYVLVIHEQTPQAMRAGVKYLFMTIAGSLAFFFGLVAIQGMTGSLDLNQVGKITEAGPLATGAFIAFVIAFGMKAGMVPLHVWLSDAHPVAPSPASALLSGVMLKTGAYGLFRVIYGIYGAEFFRAAGWSTWLQIVAAITILLGSAVAITQTDLKRRLAYSSIGQMGYILLAMGLMTERAMVGGVYHIFAHAVVKSCLFLSAGSIIRQTGLRDVRDFGGLGYRMPLTMACFTMCALTIAGIPPMNGFVSEWALMQGAFDAGLSGYAVVLMLSALMNAVYYFTIVITAYFSKPRHAEHVGEMHDEHGIIPHVTTEAPPQIIPKRHFQWLREAPPQMLVPMLILATASVIFSLIPNNWPLEMAQQSAKLLLGR